MAKTRPEQWKYKAWNTDIGRIVWWVARGSKGNRTARAAAKAFYEELVAEVGQEAARRQLGDLPSWLVGGAP